MRSTYLSHCSCIMTFEYQVTRPTPSLTASRSTSRVRWILGPNVSGCQRNNAFCGLVPSTGPSSALLRKEMTVLSLCN